MFSTGNEGGGNTHLLSCKPFGISNFILFKGGSKGVEIHIQYCQCPMITRKKKVLWESNHIAMSFLLIKYDLIIEVMPTSNTTFLNGTFVSFHWKFFFSFFVVVRAAK